MMIQLKRIYTPVASTDGFRVLADRLYPRGIKKEALQVNLWAKDIAPSTQLRKSYHANRNFETFKKLYTEELQKNEALPDFVTTLKKYEIVTLLTASKEIELSALPILKEVIEEKLLTS